MKHLPKILLLSLIFLFLAVVFPRQIWIPAVALVFLFAVVVFEKKFVIFFVIISFLTLTTTISPVLRLTVQITNILLLAYFFIRENGNPVIDFPRVPKELGILVCVLLSIMLISSLASNYTKEGLEQLSRSGVFFLIVYLLYSIIKSESDLKVLVTSLMIVGTFYSFYLLFELYKADFNFISLNQEQTIYFGMEYLNKNYLGGFLSMGILLMMSFMFRKGNKTWLVFLVFIFFCGLILTSSRAALIALIIAVSVLVYQSNRKFFFRGLAAAAFLFLILYMSPVYDYIMVYARVENVVSGRDYLLEATYNVIGNHYLLGAGPAATKYEMYTHIPFMYDSPGELFLRRSFYMTDSGQAHNFYLFLFSDLGIIGFICAVAFPVIYFRIYRRVMKQTEQNTDKFYLLRGFMAIGIFMFLRALFEPAGIFTFGNIVKDLPFWIIIIILCYYYAGTASEKSEKADRVKIL